VPEHTVLVVSLDWMLIEGVMIGLTLMYVVSGNDLPQHALSVMRITIYVPMVLKVSIMEKKPGPAMVSQPVSCSTTQI
jgi:hypothetical protein